MQTEFAICRGAAYLSETCFRKEVQVECKTKLAWILPKRGLSKASAKDSASRAQCQIYFGLPRRSQRQCRPSVKPTCLHFVETPPVFCINTASRAPPYFGLPRHSHFSEKTVQAQSVKLFFRFPGRSLSSAWIAKPGAVPVFAGGLAFSRLAGEPRGSHKRQKIGTLHCTL